jgi:predicted Fe-Mo cluster-binding NifX family protein
MKKIAVATDNNNASGHFGHCQGFTIYETDKKEVLKRSFTPNPGHRPGFLPRYLKEMDVDVIISGNMGASAQDLFNENGIQVIVGAEGDIDDLVMKYLSGELSSTNSFCQH